MSGTATMPDGPSISVELTPPDLPDYHALLFVRVAPPRLGYEAADIVRGSLGCGWLRCSTHAEKGVALAKWELWAWGPTFHVAAHDAQVVEEALARWLDGERQQLSL